MPSVEGALLATALPRGRQAYAQVTMFVYTGLIQV